MSQEKSEKPVGAVLPMSPDQTADMLRGLSMAIDQLKKLTDGTGEQDRYSDSRNSIWWVVNGLRSYNEIDRDLAKAWLEENK